jgi:flagellar P-ring protein precursor FlgI
MNTKKYFPAAALILALSIPAHAQTRIKDIAHISGVRGNTLVGYGLVMGLNKTGDKKQTLFPQQTLVNMLAQFGLTLNGNIRVENIAGVIVTADLPAFARPGSPIDVTISSIGDATSLQGGVLLRTPLNGPDGQTYALASGSLVLGGYSAGNAGTGITVNHPTVGRIPNGGTVERAVTVGAPQVVETLDLILDQLDFTNVGRVVSAINGSFGGPIASPVDG